MKKAGDVIVSGLKRTRRKSTSGCPHHTRCRRLSSAPEAQGKFASSSGSPRQRWDPFVSNPSHLGDSRSHKRQPSSPVLEPAKAFWPHPQPAWRQLLPECQFYQPESDKSENPNRLELDEAACRNLCEVGQLTEAVKALEILSCQGSHVSRSLFYQAIKGCTKQRDLVLGRRVHALSVQNGYESDTFLANHTICMYSSFGMLAQANEVFSCVAAPDMYMWSSLILAHARHGQPAKAIQLYRQMRKSTVKPDTHIFVATLKACARAADLAAGREVHADILGTAPELDTFVGSSLVDMYAKCGSLDNARRVFDSLPTRDVVTWTAMIAGYAQHGFGQQALALYACMLEEDAGPANSVTFVALLQACARIGDLTQGKQLHAQAQHLGLDGDVFVGNCLVDMYSKCGSIGDARRVFDRLSSKDVVTWTAMISGCVQSGLGQEALRLYESMQDDQLSSANEVTYACLLQACASVGAVHLGKKLHAKVMEKGLGTDVVLANCLVHMYSKCGSMDDARKVFDSLQTKNVVTWNALLTGYAQHSKGHLAISSFKEMQDQGVEPDDVTFNSLLVACSHEGLVDEGQRFFQMMLDKHNIAPTAHNCITMVDLFGRAGRLDDAEKLLQTVPSEDVVGLTSLLNACKSHGDLERGQRCFERLIKLEPENGTPYALLAGMYASVGRWADAQRIESLRKSAGALKKPAQACIEVRNQVHEFIVGEERADVSSKLRSVNLRLRENIGLFPETDRVLQSETEGAKEDSLCGHAEKLALAFGLLNTPAGSTLFVTKNLRMCNDCHNGTKVMSRLEKREIIVRDAHRVHHFVDGSCSCGDLH